MLISLLEYFTVNFRCWAHERRKFFNCLNIQFQFSYSESRARNASESESEIGSKQHYNAPKLKAFLCKFGHIKQVIAPIMFRYCHGNFSLRILFSQVEHGHGGWNCVINFNARWSMIYLLSILLSSQRLAQVLSSPFKLNISILRPGRFRRNMNLMALEQR